MSDLERLIRYCDEEELDLSRWEELIRLLERKGIGGRFLTCVQSFYPSMEKEFRHRFLLELATEAYKDFGEPPKKVDTLGTSLIIHAVFPGPSLPHKAPASLTLCGRRSLTRIKPHTSSQPFCQNCLEVIEVRKLLDTSKLRELHGYLKAPSTRQTLHA